MDYKVKLEQFQGPLDVLLQLIEQQELDITEISLAKITKSFIKHLDKVESYYPEELADFLVIATKLLYIKSRSLLPYLESEEEESASQLAERLKMYKEFRDATVVLEDWLKKEQFSVRRPVSLSQLRTVEFSPPTNVSGELLSTTYQSVIDRVETVIRIPKAAISKAVTLKEKITTLSQVLNQHKEINFHSLIDEKTEKIDIVMTFLAVLELIKQNSVEVEQSHQYSDIKIKQTQV